MAVPSLALGKSLSIPQIGLGTSPMNDDQAERAVVTAIELGYRHIDTALRYQNETGVGRGIRASGVAREDLFVTTKVDGPYQGEGRARQALQESLERLGLEYVDLYLIHWPLPDRDLFVSTWRTLIELRAEGKAKAIGASNFKPGHIDRLIAETGVVPAANQIQINPFITRDEQRAYDAAHGIVTVSWSPIGAGRDLLATPLFSQIGARYGKSPSQVVLRWHVQLGLVAVPRSTNAERMRQNIDIFDFELTADEVGAISALSQGPHAGVDSDRIGH